MNNYLTKTFLLISLSFFAYLAQATCKENFIGAVYCSIYPGGGAEENSLGTVKCGKGECKEDLFGTIKCSKTQGGGAALNYIGTVKCLDGCETGSTSMCTKGKS